MKFVFIENRYKTHFWEVVAEQLRASGHQVAWVVQNVQFTPRLGEVRCIPYPRRTDYRGATSDGMYRDIAKTDRRVLYFGGTDEHYSYYADKINRHLTDLAPDVLVGESTLFHELMTIRWARDNGVPYLHPTSPGYPVGRFVVYGGDTKIPVGGCGEVLADEACDDLIAAISQRKIVPDYMKRPQQNVRGTARKWPSPGSFGARIAMLRSYARGERFNTPGPLRRLALGASKRRRLAEWRELARMPAGGIQNGSYVLYPLQMQPEANLDVWGNRYRDQAALIKQLDEVLPPAFQLIVKANPKASMELSKELISVLRNSTRIVALPMEVLMGEVLPHVSAVITVTGTVAIECLLTDKPVLVLGPSVVAGFPGVVDGASGQLLASSVQALLSNQAGRPSHNDKRNLIRRLYTSTYPGIVSDPCHEPRCIDPMNVEKIASGLLKSMGAI